MTDRSRHRLLSLLPTVALLAACGTATAPERAVVPNPAATTPTDPTFLSLAPGAPSLANTTLSFYAVKGQDADVALWYHPRVGQADSTRLLRFRLDRRSLCNRPDGTPLASGDALLITLTVVDPQKQIVRFEPSGLTFCRGREATLNMWYLEVDHDFDHDGNIDGKDRAIERSLAIWRQESSTQPWSRLLSTLLANEDEVEVEIPGFTNYVVAY